MSFNPEDASGSNTYNVPRALELNEILLNGDADAKETSPGQFKRAGGYFRKRIWIGKPKDEKPEEINLGNPLSLVMLKIRRKLVQRGQDGEIVRSTSEHTHKGEAVMLFEGDNRPIVGTAEDLRTKFEGLRTVQIVYALLWNPTTEPELVKFIVKGSALGSEAQAKDRTNFYDYLKSFGKDTDGNKEHFYQYATVLNAVIEEGKKTYFTIDFKRGAKLDPAAYELALKHMEQVHNKCEEIDLARNAKIAKGAVIETEIAPGRTEGDFSQDVPKDDINPDDIPF